MLEICIILRRGKGNRNLNFSCYLFWCWLGMFLDFAESKIEEKRVHIRVSNNLQASLFSLFFLSSFLYLFEIILLFMFVLAFCSDDDEDKIISNVECHYAQAQIGECIFNIGDCAHIKVILFTSSKLQKDGYINTQPIHT